MSSVVPDTTPALWNILIQKGATWPGTTISMTRDGVQVIPASASLVIYDPNGILQVSLIATIDAGGVMTVPSISGAVTATYTWSYGNLVFQVVESTGAITHLLAGNATVVSRSD